MDLADIDYQGLFEVMRKENERLRIQIVGLKDSGYSLKERINDWMTTIIQEPYATLIIFGVVSILIQLIPLLQVFLEKKNEK